MVWLGQSSYQLCQTKPYHGPIQAISQSQVSFIFASELEAAFQELKSLIIEAIKEGVRIFDPARRTSLRKDCTALQKKIWSTQLMSMIPICVMLATESESDICFFPTSLDFAVNEVTIFRNQ